MKAGNNLKWKTERRKVDQLLPYDKNPRTITPEQADQLRASLEKFDLAEIPAIDTDGRIVAGHQRVAMLKILGRGAEVIDVRVPNRKLTASEFKEYNLRSNKTTAGWDQDLLGHIEEDILVAVGFSPNELDDICKLEGGSKDPDEVPEAPAKPKAKLGDIYELGEHRLMCGDSTSPADLAALMTIGGGAAVADLVFTDPPYNVNYSGTGKKTKTGIKNDNLDAESFRTFSEAVFQNMAAALKPGGVYYVCSGWSSYPVFHQALIAAGLYRSGVIIWEKDNAALGWNDFRYKHEWILTGKNKKGEKAVSILYGWKDGPHYFRDTRDEYDVWRVPRKHAGNYVHPTEKPVYLIEKALANSTKRGENVLDLFGGSGSTLIACERMSRRAFLMEFDPKFVDVILERWETFTGKKATHLNAKAANAKKQ